MKLALVQTRNAFVVVYSIFVMATVIPEFLPSGSKLIVLPYFLLVPGYYIASLLDSGGKLMDRIFYTFSWSVATYVGVYALSTIVSGSFLPITLIVPLITIVLLTYEYYFDTLRHHFLRLRRRA
jgi:hypothetical protein